MRGRGIAHGLGVVLGLFLVLLGGFVLVLMLPVVSIAGGADVGHFGAVIVYLAAGAVPLFLGVKISGSNKPKAVVATVIASLAALLAAGAMVHSLWWISQRPEERIYLVCDSLFWAVDLAIAIFIRWQSLAVVRSEWTSAK